MEHRASASATIVNKMAYFDEAAGWDDLIQAIRDSKFTVEQETIS